MSKTTVPKKWQRPQEVDDLTFAFPADVEGKLMPRYADLPEEFRTPTEASAPWFEFQERWFACGLKDMEGVRPSQALVDAVVGQQDVGVQEAAALVQSDIDKAFRHLGAVQRSFQPKHEHKMAGVAWLASLWFSEVVWKEKADA